MTLFARTCILTNLCLTSLLVFGMATVLGQTADYKATFADAERLRRWTHEALRDEVADFEARRGQLERAIARMDTQRIEAAEAMASATARTLVLRRQLADVGDTIRALDATRTRLAQSRRRLDARKRTLTAEIAAARNAHDAAVRGRREAEARITLVAAEALALRTTLGALELRVARRLQQAGELERIVARIQIRFPRIRLARAAVPLIRGRVSALSLRDDLVMIDRGRDHGVEEGHEFAIRRGGARIGTLRIDRVFAERSSARIDRNQMQGVIGVGDPVATEPIPPKEDPEQ